MASTLRKYFLLQTLCYLVVFCVCTGLGLLAASENLSPNFSSWFDAPTIFLNLWDLGLLTVVVYLAVDLVTFAWLVPFYAHFPLLRKLPALVLFGGLVNIVNYFFFVACFIARAPAQARTSIAKGVVPMGELAMGVLPGEQQVVWLTVLTVVWLSGATLFSATWFYQKRRKGFLFATITVAFVGLGSYALKLRSLENQTAGRPNVLVIAVDSLRPDRLSFAGHERSTTPKLDAYLRRSVYFENMHTSIARTTPSWTSILTGTYPHAHGIHHMFPRPEDRTSGLPSLIDALKKQSYRTALVGDYAAETFSSLDFGFDRLDVPAAFSLAQFLRQDFLQAHVILPAFLWGSLAQRLIPELSHGVFSADPRQVSDRLTGFLSEFNQEQKPWLGIVFYSNLHYPYANTYPYYGLFSDPTYEGRSKYSYNVGNLPELLRLGRAPPREEIAQVGALYDGALRRVDDEIGRFMSELQTRGMLQNTIVVFMSDHGEFLFDDGKIVTHGSWLEEHGHDTRMVFAILDLAGRDTRLQARRVPEVTRSIDVGSTLLDVLGMPGQIGEGVPLLRSTKVPELIALSETDIAFHSELEWQDTGALVYPEIMSLLEPADDNEGTLMLQRRYGPIVRQAKWRIVRSNQGTLLYRPQKKGGSFQYFGRKEGLREELVRRLELERDMRLDGSFILHPRNTQ